MPEVVPIQQEQGSGLVQTNQEMRSRQEHRTAGADVQVVRAHCRFIVGRKPIRHAQSTGGTELVEALAVIGTAEVRVERPVAGHDVNVSVGIGGGRHAAGPDGPFAAVRFVIENRHLLEIGGVVAEQPAFVGRPVAVRPERHVNHIAQQQQAGPLEMMQGVKHFVPHRSLNHHRPAEFFPAACEVQRVQPLEIIGNAAAGFLGLGNDVKRARIRINRRCAGDADLGLEVAATIHVWAGNGRPEVDPPQRAAGRGIVVVEGIHAVMSKAMFVILAAVAAFGALAHCQGTFQNLDFEAARVILITNGPYYGDIATTNALPGWSAFAGTNQLSAIPFDNGNRYSSSAIGGVKLVWHHWQFRCAARS
ncbi:MAG: hypothetical protein KGJ60_08435 [Verrucomicrobiota bacterium]|nr:hypothetical protein [Verrucomicrobiota bacterium]